MAKVAPEFAIDRSEAEALANSFCAYARHHNIVVDPRTRDLIALIGVVVAVEGPRLMRVSSRRSAAKRAARVDAAARAQAAGNVVEMGGVRGI
jgi:uncharacterized Rossmann fold enzyme